MNIKNREQTFIPNGSEEQTFVYSFRTEIYSENVPKSVRIHNYES